VGIFVNSNVFENEPSLIQFWPLGGTTMSDEGRVKLRKMTGTNLLLGK